MPANFCVVWIPRRENKYPAWFKEFKVAKEKRKLIERNFPITGSGIELVMTGQYHHPELQFIFTALKHQQGVLQNTILRQKKKKKKSITMSWAQIVNLCNTAGFSAITHHRVFSSCCNHTSYVLRKGMLRQQENCKATYLPLFLPQWREALQTLPGHWQDTNQSLPLLLYRHWQWPLKEALKWKLSARGLKLLLILLCIDLWHAPTLAQSRRS